jgi:uncharacterized membrane protein
MSRFVVVVFPDEAKAYQGTRALKELHAEGSLTLYGMAIVSKDAEGKLAIKEAADSGPLGMAVGALVGGLVGLLAGPVGLIAGSLGGTAIGGLVDMLNYGVDADFVAKVSDELTPGRCAVIAEVVETWTTPLDTRMEAAGGTVLRTWRADFEDEQIAKEVAANKADWEQLKAEYAQASADAKARLKTKLDEAEARFKAARQRLEAKRVSLDNELKTKVAAMERQLSDARADAREEIEQRIAALRSDHKTRSDKLKAAWDLTKEAFGA